MEKTDETPRFEDAFLDEEYATNYEILAERAFYNDDPKAVEYAKIEEELSGGPSFTLAKCYFLGKFIEQNYDEAFKRFAEFREMNVKTMLFELALCYRYGLGTKVDNAAYLDCLRKYVNSNYRYENGGAPFYDAALEILSLPNKSEDDILEAMTYFGIAKDLGDERAIRRYPTEGYFVDGEFLEYRYDGGDYDQILFDAEQGDAVSQWQIGDFYLKGLDNNPYQETFNIHRDDAIRIEPDYKKAKEWFEKAASKGDAYAYYSLGRMYHVGLGVEVDYAKAAEYYKKSLEGKVITPEDAEIWRATYLTKSNNVFGIDFKFTVDLENNSINKNHEEKMAKCFYKDIDFNKKKRAKANFYLGVLYLNGDGVPQNDDKAFEYVSTAANMDDVDGLYALAYCYQYGIGTKRSEKKSVYYYNKSADRQPKSMLQLGIYYYYENFETRENLAKATEYIQRAALYNFVEAQEFYANMSRERAVEPNDLFVAYRFYNLTADNYRRRGWMADYLILKDKIDEFVKENSFLEK